MKKSIRIRIPEPCHKDWQKMTQTQKGKFCGVCTKEVIDFTSKTDEDLVKIIADSKNTCGRFKKSQLNRELTLERKSRLSLAPYAASLLVPLSMLNTNHASPSNSSMPEKTFSSLNIGRFSKPSRVIINTKGIITDLSGNALSNVIVRANESKKLVKSDLNGYYSITTIGQETLRFEYDGFFMYQIKLDNYSSEKNISMTNEIIMGGIKESYMEEEIDETEIMGDMIEVSEEVIINGTIRGEDGLPLSDANIITKGQKNKSKSDLEGNYSLPIEANQTLQFSHPGYITKSISVSNISNHLDVNLEISEEFLEGAIVIDMPDNNKRNQHKEKKATRKLNRSQRK